MIFAMSRQEVFGTYFHGNPHHLWPSGP